MKKYKPTSPGRRDGSVIEYRKKLTSTQSNPLKTLTKGKRSTGGRNSDGRITVHYRGGGNKRTYRLVDFKYDKKEVPAKSRNNGVRSKPIWFYRSTVLLRW